MSDPVVIIGAGQAGAKAAETLRKLGVTQPILMFGEEKHLPYQRPPLSKKFLLGGVPESQLQLQTTDFYARNNIEVVTGKRVVRLDPDGHSIEFEDGTRQTFDKALITTGSSPRRLNVEGADLQGVHALRSIAHVLAMRDELPAANDVVIVGGGYLGLETAAVMSGLGKSVVLIEAEDRILARVAGVEIAEHLARLHANRGVKIITRARLSKIVGSARVAGVELGDGTRYSADLVLIAVGGIANDELARLSGLACNDGVLVDTGGSTGWRGVYAAGDCARFFSRRYGRFVRLESVQNANDQARAVAEHMAGRKVTYDPVPWFWSDQFETKLQIAGLSSGFDRHEVVGDPQGASFSVAYYAGARLLAVDAINDGKAYMRARKALAESAPLTSSTGVAELRDGSASEKAAAWSMSN